MSKVKDMSLAPEGVRKIEWVQKHMPVLENIKVYALACGYTWYHQDMWSDKITEYIENSKEVQN